MKKSLLLVAITMSLAMGFAHAGNDKDGNVTATGGTGYGGAGGAGGAGGSSAAVAGAAAVNVNDIKNSVNTNIDASTRSNATSTVLGSGNSAVKTDVDNTATGGAGGSTGAISVKVEGQKYRPTANTAMGYAAAPSAPCMGSSGGGVQGIVGVSFSTTWTSEGCEFRESVRAAANFGDPEVAEEMLVGGMPAYAAAKERVEARKAATKK